MPIPVNAAKASSSVANPGSPAKRALLTGENEESILFLCKALTEHRYEVSCTANLAQSFHVLAHDKPEIILITVGEIQSQTLDICHQIRSTPATAAIPIIIISASQNSSDKVKAFEMGCVDCISEPFELPELLIRIQNQLEFQSTRKQLDYLTKELEQRVLERTLQLQTVHQRLKASEERLESILNALQDVVWSAAVDPFQSCSGAPLPTTGRRFFDQ